MTWFLQFSTLPNTTQFWTYYYFLLQYYFSSSEIYYFAFLIIFFLFILNHTRLPSPRFLHSILLNFITSSSTLLHVRFTFLLIHNFCVFYQYQCGSASSQVLSLKFLNMIFFLAVQVHLFISFLFIFFSFWGFFIYIMQICFGFKKIFYFILLIFF